MSWGIDFKADIFLSRQSYSTRREVESRIEDLNEIIAGCESKLKMYASATPRDIISIEDADDMIHWLGIRVGEELELYREYVIDRYNLALYLDYLDEDKEPTDGETV